MDKPRPCGCKGRRTCLICEADYAIELTDASLDKSNGYVYCVACSKAWPGWDLDNNHPNHSGQPLDYPGIYVEQDFLSEAEEQALITGIDGMPWDLSQSGRRKQNFGPKCNFKGRKLRVGDFGGFPAFSKFVQAKFELVPILKGYKTIEQCSLEYNPERGASIDPHVDDCWVWGERIITVNLLADSVLTMTYNDKANRYNLDCVAKYPAVLSKEGKLNVDNGCYKVQPINKEVGYPVVRIPMPRRSLLVMYGSARYDWEHRILREDIKERRVCLAYREFTPPYLPDGDKYKEGEEILKQAVEFF